MRGRKRRRGHVKLRFDIGGIPERLGRARIKQRRWLGIYEAAPLIKFAGLIFQITSGRGIREIPMPTAPRLLQYCETLLKAL